MADQGSTKPPKLTKEDIERLMEEGQEFRKEIERQTRDINIPTCRCPKCGHVLTDNTYLR